MSTDEAQSPTRREDYLTAKRVKHTRRQDKDRTLGTQLRAAKSLANLHATLGPGECWRESHGAYLRGSCAKICRHR